MGSFKVPFGYKFQPTNQDLVCHLQHKAAGNPLPSHGFIEECDLYNVEPDELFRGSKMDGQYFFVKLKKKTQGGSRFSRRVGTKATWKGSNKGSSVHNLGGLAVGVKKNFVYMLINGKDIIHGGYIMDEFSLQESIPNIEGYVLCRVKKKLQRENDIHQAQDQDDHQDANNHSHRISEVVDDPEEAMPVADEDQIQEVDDFVDIDEYLLVSIGEDDSSSPYQLHADQTLPTLINNADEYQVQEVDDFIEIDELLSNIGEDNNSSSRQLHDDQTLPTLINITDEDQVQDVEDFIEIDELLSSIGEDNSSSCQLNSDRTLPTLINNADEDQVQDFESFTEIDELLPSVCEENSSSQMGIFS